MFNLKKSGIAAVAVTAVAAMLGSFGLAAPALAADTPTIGTDKVNGTITVSNVEVGATVTAYKMINVNYTNAGTKDAPSYVPTTPQYTWTDAVAGWVKGQYRQYIGDNHEVTKAYTSLTSDPTNDENSGAPDKETGKTSEIAKFYDEFSAAFTEGAAAENLPVAATANAEGTAGTDTTVTLDVPVGGYLVRIENNGNANGTVGDWSYRPVAVDVNFKANTDSTKWEINSATVVAKRSRAGLDKSVNEKTNDGHNNGKNESNQGSDTVAVGDTVRFDLRSDVPVFPTDAIDKTYVLADKMDDALTPNYDNNGDHIFKVYGYKGTEKFPDDKSVDENADNLLKEGVNYTLTKNTTDLDADNNAATWRLDFNYDTIRQYNYIHVVYTATVNEKAVVGEPIYNNAKLQYSNNPYEHNSHRTVPDEVKLYTFGIKVLKQFYDDKGVLLTDKLPQGAEFAVYKNGADKALSFVKVANGEYRAAKAGEAGVTSLPVDAEGHLKVSGINKGKYQLEETQAPVGYIKLSGKIDVEIIPVTDGNKDYTGAVEGKTGELGFVSTTINNTKGWLPKTGSAGMVVMTVAGVLLVAAGVTVLARKRRA